ncbi:MAG: N-acetylmuramoyl-L-alanine amidase [Candidatus Kapabacteria bacterium]|nr:N-acetylmuramoyl-L-alanine amidase [Candidatus Kapabacteria bacterium]
MAARLIHILILIFMYGHAHSTPVQKSRTIKPQTRQSGFARVVVKLSVNATPQRNVSCIILNQRAYSSLNHIAQQTFGSTSKNGIIQTSFGTLTAASSSNMLTFSGEGLNTTAQMLLSTIDIKGELFVPVGEFYRALESLKLYAVSMSANAILIRESTQMPAKSDAVNESTIDDKNSHTERTSSIPEAEKQYKQKTQPVEVTPQPAVPKPRNVPPARYLLPPDLKRRELDIPTKSDGSWKHDFPIDDERSLAMLSSAEMRSLNRISSIRSEVKGTTTIIKFIADRAFFGRPTAFMKGSVVTVTFPNTVNADKTIKAIRKLNIKSATTEFENGTQSYIISLKREDRIAELSFPSPSVAELRIKPAPQLTVATQEKKKWTLDCIVLDAGHGGKDNGAESITGVYEKDVALSIVLKLRDEIKRRYPSLKVVLTRSSDTFVELDKRGEIANAAGGKLFISIHCNSMPSKPHPAHGFETYILSPAKTDNAIAVATAENAVVKLEDKSERYQKYDDDQLIIATLAQHTFVTMSEKFAGLVQKSLNATTTMTNRGVNQAGFIVLIGASMPSVLIETGFLSNSQDEKVLTTSTGRASIAKGISNAIGSFLSAYTSMLHE